MEGNKRDFSPSSLSLSLPARWVGVVEEEEEHWEMP